MIEDLEEQVREVTRVPYAGPTIHPLASREELTSSSPVPFKGRPDPDHADLDSLDPLYIPRYLVRVWGLEVFLGSAYYKLWEVEAKRWAKKFETDPKASERKGKR